MNGAEMPTAMSPSPAGSAKAAGSLPMAMATRNTTPTTRNDCGSTSLATEPGALSALATGPIAVPASATSSAPPAAMPIHGGFPDADWRNAPASASSALAAIQAAQATANPAAVVPAARRVPPAASDEVNSPAAVTAGIPMAPIRTSTQT